MRPEPSGMKLSCQGRGRTYPGIIPLGRGGGGDMSRRLVRLTQDTLADLPAAVRAHVLWEVDPVRRRQLMDGPAAEAEAEKAAWVSEVLLEWGSCGRVAYVDDEVAGF